MDWKAVWVLTGRMEVYSGMLTSLVSTLLILSRMKLRQP